MKALPTLQLPAVLAPILALATLLQASPDSEASSSAIVTPPLTDDAVERAVERALRYDLQVDGSDIDIDVEKGVVELSGFIENLPMKRHAVELVETRKGVRSIVDRMEVRGIRIDDEAIQHSLDRALEFQAATFGIEVEPIVNDGVVRLHGKVESFALSDLIERTAESIAGVRAVSNMLHVEADDARDDAELRNHIELALAQDPWIDAGLVKMEVDEGKVEVSGMVDALSEKRRLRETIGGIPGVNEIDDSQLAIRVDATLKKPAERHKPPERSDDEIERSVEDALRFDPRVRGSRLEVAVLGGVVSLNGTVDNLKAHRAAEANARQTPGVSQVYNFSKIRPENPLPDEKLAKGLEQLLQADTLLTGAEFGDITANAGLVRLRGEVKSEYQRQRAENLAAGAIGVREIRNYLRVDWPLPEAYRDLVE